MIRRSARRAEAFDHAWTHRGHAAHLPLDAELAELVATADQVVSSASAEPDPAFSVALRERLMSAAPSVMVAGEPDPTALLAPPPQRDSRRGRLRVAAAGLAIVIGGAGTVAASASAAPGDLLYGIKITTEKIERAAATSDERLGHVLLGQAEERLDEALEVAGDRYDLVTVNDLLAEFSASADRGTILLIGDPRHPDASTDDLAFIATFTESSSAKLTELSEFLPPTDRSTLEAAIAELLSIAADLGTSCPACLPTSATDSLVSLGELTSTVDEAAQNTPMPTATPAVPGSTEAPAPDPAETTPPAETPWTDKPLLAAPTTPPESLGDVLEPVTGGLLGNKDQQGIVPGLVNGLGLGGLLGGN